MQVDPAPRTTHPRRSRGIHRGDSRWPGRDAGPQPPIAFHRRAM